MTFAVITYPSARCPPVSVHRATIGDRTFALAGARLWNSLPPDIVACDTLPRFWRELKTFLFRQCYPSILISFFFVVIGVSTPSNAQNIRWWLVSDEDVVTLSAERNKIISSNEIRSLQYVVKSCFSKNFQTRSDDIIAVCMNMFNCLPVADAIARRKSNFV